MHTRARLVVLLALAAASGCAPSAELVRVDGSAGVAPLIVALADAYRAAGGRDSIVIATGMGSSARAAAVLDARIHVAMASHGVDTADLRQRGITIHEIARTPVVFAVNAGVPARGVTGAQACDVYAGRTTVWQVAGGPNLPIVPAMRPADEVDAEVMRASVPCLRTLALAPSVRVIARPDSMAAFLAATPGAFGITSGTFVAQSGGRIRALDLDGVPASAANVAAGRSPSRSSFLLTPRTPSAGVRRFLRFVRSEAGRRVIEESGGVAIP